MVILKEAFVAPTTDEAYAAVEQYPMDKYQRYVEWGQNDAGISNGTTGRDAFRELATDCFLIGTSAEICAEIDRYPEDFDPEGFTFRVN